MASISRIATGCGFALIVIFLISVDQSAPANAQGGIVCAYGSKKYKECCKQSYKEHPKLGANARGRDIDACINPKRPAKEPAKSPPKDPPKEKG
jgi:hypothetical protein